MVNRPSKDKESDWRPSPANGVFGVVMRLYAPKNLRLMVATASSNMANEEVKAIACIAFQAFGGSIYVSQDDY